MAYLHLWLFSEDLVVFLHQGDLALKFNLRNLSDRSFNLSDWGCDRQVLVCLDHFDSLEIDHADLFDSLMSVITLGGLWRLNDHPLLTLALALLEYASPALCALGLAAAHRALLAAEDTLHLYVDLKALFLLLRAEHTSVQRLDSVALLHAAHSLLRNRLACQGPQAFLAFLLTLLERPLVEVNVSRLPVALDALGSFRRSVCVA